jgi:hypothetical protein
LRYCHVLSIRRRGLIVFVSGLTEMADDVHPVPTSSSVSFIVRSLPHSPLLSLCELFLLGGRFRWRCLDDWADAEGFDAFSDGHCVFELLLDFSQQRVEMFFDTFEEGVGHAASEPVFALSFENINDFRLYRV